MQLKKVWSYFKYELPLATVSYLCYILTRLSSFLRSPEISGTSFLKMLSRIMNLSPDALLRRCSVEKTLLKISQISRENTSSRVSFLIKLQAGSKYGKIGTPVKMFSCEFCETFKNIYFA